MGRDLCYKRAWLDVVSAYLATVVGTAAALRPYPRIARAFLRPIFAPRKKIETILENAREIIDPAIAERRTSDTQHVDLLSFLVQSQRETDSMTIILQLLVLTSAAVSEPFVRIPGLLRKRPIRGSTTMDPITLCFLLGCTSSCNLVLNKLPHFHNFILRAENDDP